MKPLVSVILPVYNAENFVKEAIMSVLNQTYTHFELIILNDGSTDGSANVIRSIKDDRIIYSEHANMGLAATLNKGIALAKGSLIARQDNDDVSLPSRFEKQVAFLEKNKTVDLLGTAAEIIDASGNSTGRYHRHALDNVSLKFALVFDNPFVHSSVMLRSSAIAKVGVYTTERDVFEDHNLWSRIARSSNISNLPECLIKYRELSSGMSKSSVNYNALVKNQSLQNVRFYSPLMNEEDALLFIDQEQLLKKCKTADKAIREYTNLLNTFVERFCRMENYRASELEEQKTKQLILVKRKIFNAIIYSGDSGRLEKTKARVRRKMLFIFHKRNLD